LESVCKDVASTFKISKPFFGDAAVAEAAQLLRVCIGMGVGRGKQGG